MDGSDSVDRCEGDEGCVCCERFGRSWRMEVS